MEIQVVAERDTWNTGSFSKPGPSPALLSPSIVWAAQKYLTYRIVLPTAVIPAASTQFEMRGFEAFWYHTNMGKQELSSVMERVKISKLE